MSIWRVHSPSLRVYFLASLVIAHRQPIVAHLSALVECIVLGSPSTGPSPYIFVVMSFGVFIAHADDPTPDRTDASDPPMRVPRRRDRASSAIRPDNFICPVILLHILAWLHIGGSACGWVRVELRDP